MKTLALTLLLLTVSGCATRRAAQTTHALNELKMLVLACHNYSSTYRKLPDKLDDVAQFLHGAEMDLSAYELLYTGRVEACETPSETLLLRQREPLPGGEQAVAYVDGSVEALPANH